MLEVIECDCGFHLGLDACYLGEVGDVHVVCPSCHMIIDTAEVLNEEEEQ